MLDPRITKLAKVLTQYSLEIKPGQKFMITALHQARELTLAVYEEAIKLGAHVYVDQPLAEAQELFYKYASDAQLDFEPPMEKLLNETFDAHLSIWSTTNTRTLSGVDPQRIARRIKATSEIKKTRRNRTAAKEFNWSITAFPNDAFAQEADMSLRDYTEFVFGAGLLNEADPVAAWRDQGVRQQALIDWLHGRDKAVIKGANIDLTLSIRDRVFINAQGTKNFPDGEIFTGPVEDSVNGWVRFGYPALYSGQEITDIELWFENGQVVKEKATKNQDLLTSVLNTDPGARFLGEWGIGTNYGITKFTKNMLFDEKIGGTFHFAVGACYPESGAKNQSGVHWDMLCDMGDGEVTIDGELFYKDGKPVIGEW